MSLTINLGMEDFKTLREGHRVYVNFPFFGTHPIFFFKKLHFVYPKY